jgi:hypothetical protein
VQCLRYVHHELPECTSSLRPTDLFSLLLDISLARDSTDGRKHLLEEIDIQVFSQHDSEVLELFGKLYTNAFNYSLWCIPSEREHHSPVSLQPLDPYYIDVQDILTPVRTRSKFTFLIAADRVFQYFGRRTLGGHTRDRLSMDPET